MVKSNINSLLNLLLEQKSNVKKSIANIMKAIEEGFIYDVSNSSMIFRKDIGRTVQVRERHNVIRSYGIFDKRVYATFRRNF